MAIKELYNRLKDHRNPFMQELVTDSYQKPLSTRIFKCTSNVADPFTRSERLRHGKTSVRVTLVNPSFQPSLKELCHGDFADFLVLAVVKLVVCNLTHEKIITFEHLKEDITLICG